MPERRQSAVLLTDELLTGHFHARRGYGIVRPHGSADWLLILTIAGRGRFGCDGGHGEVGAEPGDAVLLRPGTYHDYGVEPTLERWELVWTHFLPRAEWLPLLAWPEEAPGLMRLRLDGAAARQAAAGLDQVDALARGSRHPSRYAMNRLERLLLDLDAHNPRSAQARLDPRVRAALDYLARNLHARLTLADLAAAAGLSVSRLAHLFHDQTGSTPQRAIEQARMRRAQELLGATAQPIAAIAAEVGFSDAFYFSSRFRRRVGLSPRAFRRRAQGGRGETPH